MIRDNLLNSGPEAHGQAYFGQGQGDIYVENVQCNGSESSLEDCPASELGVHNCHHSDDAGVKCQSMSLYAYNIKYLLFGKWIMVQFETIFHRFMYRGACDNISW